MSAEVLGFPGGADRAPDTAGAARPGAPSGLRVGSDIELGRLVARRLRERFGDVVHADGACYRWVGSHWAVIPEDELRLAVHELDGAVYLTPTGQRACVRLSRSRVDSILAEMRPAIARRGFFEQAPPGINCASGFIRFDGDGAPRLEPHHPDQRQRHVLPGRWTPEAPAAPPPGSLLHRLLSGCFAGDADAAAKSDLLAEVAGVAALGHGPRLRQPKAVVLYGPTAANGKSQVLDLFRALLPPDAVTAISPRHFGDGRYLVKLAGKLLNVPDELGGGAIAGEEFKKAVTGDRIVARDVYRSSVEFTPMAQHVCATDVLPPFRDGMDRGVRRRLLLVEFNRVIPPAERVAGLGRRIGAEEADLLLAWAVAGAQRVLARGEFAEPASAREALSEWVLGSDPVAAWLEDEEAVACDGSLAPLWARDAYKAFQAWAAVNGYRGAERLVQGAFTQRVTAAGKAGVSYRRVKKGGYFTGLVLRGA